MAAWVETTEVSPAKSDEGLDAPTGPQTPVPGVPLPAHEDVLTTPTRRPGSRIPGPPASFRPTGASGLGGGPKPDWEDPTTVTPQASPATGPRSNASSPAFGVAAGAAAVAEAEQRRRGGASASGAKPAWVMPDLDMPEMPEVHDFQDFVQRRKTASKAGGLCSC
jgi:hypothetical protein